MEDTTELGVFDRLKIASNSLTDADLAVNLKLTKQSIAQARTKKTVPASWIPKASKLFNVSTDWLFFGRGPMRPDEALLERRETTSQPEPKNTERCIRCAKLEVELEEERRERRELAAENRKLWKENGDLREENATLRAQPREGQEPLFDKSRKLSGTSEVMQSRP